VKDDGQGLDLDTVNKGMGLSNMRERAEEIGAEFTINSRPGHGAALSVVWIRKEESEEEANE
jgi:signal transduction histidine kinase